MILSDRALKFLRLAMCEGATQAEGVSAAVMFVAQLKKDGVRPEAFEGPSVPKGFVRVKRPQSAPTPPVGSSVRTVAASPSSPSPHTEKGDLEETPEEELQWLYEKRHQVSGRKRQMVINEMDRRGLI